MQHILSWIIGEGNTIESVAENIIVTADLIPSP